VQVQKLKASIELAELGELQQEQPSAALNNLSSLLNSLSGLQQRQQQWQQQWQQQQQQQQVPSWQSPRVPLLSQHQAPQQWSSSLPAFSPIDKVTAALQAALDAATGLNNSGEGWEAPGISSGGAGAAASAAASSSRRSSLQPSAATAGGSCKPPDLASEGSWVSDMRVVVPTETALTGCNQGQDCHTIGCVVARAPRCGELDQAPAGVA
jgi:hypothetical protein